MKSRFEHLKPAFELLIFGAVILISLPSIGNVVPLASSTCINNCAGDRPQPCKAPVVGNDKQIRFRIACCRPEPLEECYFVEDKGQIYPNCRIPSCGCADSGDLINRRKEADAAIKEYQRLKPLYANRPFSRDYRDVVQPAVQKAINSVTKTSANLVAGWTDPNSCRISVKNASSKPGKFVTPCLDQIVRSHEAVHERVCRKWRESSPILSQNPFADYRDKMSMDDVIQEEIDGYTEELQEIARKLAKMPPGCK